MTFLRNTWYAAAWSKEVAEGAVLGRTYLNEGVALFRDRAGVPHALQDRCPHRFVPLSDGEVVEDALQCPYHGLRFGGSGVCVQNPHGSIPSSARVRSYPLQERHGMIWIWLGERAGDPALLPDFSANDDETHYVGRDYLRIDAEYRLATDNILDLSHIDYVHRDSIAKLNTPTDDVRVESRTDGATLWSNRLYVGTRPMGEFGPGRGLPPDAMFDRWLDVRWNAPGCMLLFTGMTPTGLGRDQAVFNAPHTHIFTPETETSTHYWFAASHAKSAGPGGEPAAQGVVKFLRKAFETEDLPMLALQQRAMGTVDFWTQRPIVLAGDAGAVRARRMLDKMIAAEQGIAAERALVPALQNEIA